MYGKALVDSWILDFIQIDYMSDLPRTASFMLLPRPAKSISSMSTFETFSIPSAISLFPGAR